MARTLDIPELGVSVELRRTTAETAGELLEFDVIGRPRGFIALPHRHLYSSETYTVVAGSMRLVVDGRERLLGPGDSATTPVAAEHRQLAGPGGDAGHVRMQVRPAGDTEAFLERLAEISRRGGFTRGGFPKPVAAAELLRDFGHEGHGTSVPLGLQRAFARAVLAATRPYEFVDEWVVDAPPEAVFAAISDASSYPLWWRPVYIDVESDGGPAEVGKEARQHFKGRLPYHLRTRSRVTEVDEPRVLAVDVEGDLRGSGRWTLTPAGSGTHVRFDWHVHADRPLLRGLTPLLRPLLRWNHDWAIARAREGLEPYARAVAAR